MLGSAASAWFSRLGQLARNEHSLFYLLVPQLSSNYETITILGASSILGVLGVLSSPSSSERKLSVYVRERSGLESSGRESVADGVMSPMVLNIVKSS